METVVHVTTLDQLKSVLDVWFAQGYEWGGGTKKYYEEWFDSGDRFIGLFKSLVILVTDDSAGYIEYADFMAQQEKTVTKNFTEEQYQKIVDAWRSGLTYKSSTQAVTDYLIDEGINVSILGDEALALANPLTRKWAHDKFVEKKKKYLWTNKNIEKMGLYEEDGIVFPKLGHWKKLTESEIKKWGYNPDMFNREE